MAPTFRAMECWRNDFLLLLQMNNTQLKRIEAQAASTRKWVIVGIIITCFIVTGIGIWQMISVPRLTDLRGREKLLRQVATAAQSIPPDLINQLSFSPDDRENLVYQRISQFLRVTANEMRITGIFLVTLRDGKFIVGPESYPVGDKNASIPGDEYLEPPNELGLVFKTGLPLFTPKPYRDEFGEFITVYMPIADPTSGHVSFALCADLDLKLWNHLRQLSWRIPLVFTLVILALLATGGFVLVRRPPSHMVLTMPWHLRYAEVILCALIMTVLTCAMTWRIHYTERLAREAMFGAFAQQRASALIQELFSIRSRKIELRAYFSIYDTITWDSFSTFSSRFEEHPVIQTALWIPTVTQEAREQFERDARLAESPDFTIWRWEQGRQVTNINNSTIHPIRYIMPFTETTNKNLGYDCGSDPRFQIALFESFQNNLGVMSDPVSLFSEGSIQHSLVTFWPVSINNQSGAVAFVLSPKALIDTSMNQAVNLENEVLIADLFRLDEADSPIFLATSTASVQQTPRKWTEFDKSLQMKTFLFFYGKTYGVMFHPMLAWESANPLVYGLYAGIFGGALTLLLSAFLLLLCNYRIRLEHGIRRRTSELKESNDQMKSILKSIQVTVIIADKDGNVLDVDSPTGGFMLTPVEGSSSYERICTVLKCTRRHSPTDCQEGTPLCSNCILFRTIQNVAATGDSIYDSFLKIEADAEDGLEPDVHYLRFGAAPVMLDGERRVVVALYDITIWHRTEQLYSTLFKEMRYGFVLTEPVYTQGDAPADFRFTEVNPAFKTLFGRAPDEVIGQTFRAVHPDIPDSFINLLSHTLKTGDTASFDHYLRDLERYYEGTIFRPMDGAVAIIVTDVSSRKKAETRARAAAKETAQLLQESENTRMEIAHSLDQKNRAEQALIFEKTLLYVLMKNQPDRISFKDSELRFIRISDEQAKAFSLESPAEAIGKTEQELMPGQAAWKNTEQEKWILKTGEPVLAQIEKGIGAGRRPFWTSTSKVPIHDTEGRIFGLIVITRDISQEMEMQLQIQQTSKMDAIGRLVGGIVHDFNNNLQVILGYSEILLGELTPEDPHCADVKGIQDAAQRGRVLTRQLLDSSRHHSAGMQKIDINALLTSSEKMLKPLLGDQIDIFVSLGDSTMPVMADRDQIENVIINLAVNARDAMLPKGGKLTLQTHIDTFNNGDNLGKDIKPGTFVCISVIDTGSGIHPDVLPHLFEPFFTTKGAGKGTGLGLFTCYGIAKQHGGWINIYSEIGHGTAFKIYLPICLDDDLDVPLPEKVVETAHVIADADKTILVVEDDPNVRSLAVSVLRKAGYTLFVCESYEQAVECFAKEKDRIDLLFSDIMLGTGNGIDLACELQQQRTDLPVLLCSGYTDDTVHWPLIQEKGFGFLPKPYPITNLLTAIRGVFAPPDSETQGASK